MKGKGKKGRGSGPNPKAMRSIRGQIRQLMLNQSPIAYRSRISADPPRLSTNLRATRKVEFVVGGPVVSFTVLPNKDIGAAILSDLGVATMSDPIAQSMQFQVQKALIWSNAVGPTQVGLAMDVSRTSPEDSMVDMYQTDIGTSTRAARVALTLPLTKRTWENISSTFANLKYRCNTESTIQVVYDLFLPSSVVHEITPGQADSRLASERIPTIRHYPAAV